MISSTERTISGKTIFHESFLCSEVYESEKAPSEAQHCDFIEISTVVAGSGVHLIFNQPIPCREGDIFITPPNVLHEFLLESKEESMAVRRIGFLPKEWLGADVAKSEDPSFCYGIFREGSPMAYAALNNSMKSKVTEFFDDIDKELSEQKINWQGAVLSVLTQMLIHLQRYIDSSIKNEPLNHPQKWNMALSVMRIVDNEYVNPDLTLESIAKRFYVSKSTLSTLFLKLVGKRFSEYLKEVRTSHALRLLKESTLTVEEIILFVGLKDVSTFYKNFGEKMGMTPNEYRKSMLVSKQDKIKSNSSKGEKIMIVLSEISEQLQKGKAKIVKEMVQQALDEGASPEQILNEGLLAGMSVIGERFKNNEIYVPEVLVAARAMNMGAAILKPYLAAQSVQSAGKVCIGTVQGDLHDIGKNLVKMLMEGRGLEVIDLGTDVAPEKFIETVKAENCSVICLSALLTTTMPVMAEVVKAAEEAGIRDKVKIMVGGAPVNQEFCDKIGADCYTVDAATAAAAAVEFCKN